MSEINYPSAKKFDISIDRTLEIRQRNESLKIAKSVLDIARIAIDFAAVERVPRYTSIRRENDAEHSFMLGLAATEIAFIQFPELDHGLVTQFALVHDLVELETKDVPTFQLDEAGFTAKALAEKVATDKLVRSLPRYMGQLLLRYEAQVEPESRFVRHIDKLLPYGVDHVSGTLKQVMAEDYDVHALPELMVANERIESRYQLLFPEPSHKVLHIAHNIIFDRNAMEYDED